MMTFRIDTCIQELQEIGIIIDNMGHSRLIICQYDSEIQHGIQDWFCHGSSSRHWTSTRISIKPRQFNMGCHSRTKWKKVLGEIRLMLWFDIPIFMWIYIYIYTYVLYPVYVYIYIYVCCIYYILIYPIYICIYIYTYLVYILYFSISYIYIYIYIIYMYIYIYIIYIYITF